jgi:rod shape-determining protein MreC
MQQFLRFLTRIGPVLVFTLLEGVALYWLFTQNPYQQSVFFTSANQVSGKLYSVEEKVTGYFHLKQNNEALLRENNRLLEEVIRLKKALWQQTNQGGIALLREQSPGEFELIPARVLNNSVTQLHNYITLEGGALDGIEPEMGVANADGLVGVVSKVSDHYSLVISVLNPPNRFSCKLKRSNTSGSLVWDGEDRRYALLEDVPPYVSISLGDTVVTSGYSAIFPEGIMVGTVASYGLDEVGNAMRVKVKLAVHFDALSDVRVIRYVGRQELDQLMQSTVE